GAEHLEIRRLLEARYFRQRRALDEIDAAGAELLEQDDAVRDDPEDQVVEGRATAVILGVGLHHEALAPTPLDQPEGAGPDRLPVELRGVEVDALDEALGNDAGARVD